MADFSYLDFDIQIERAPEGGYRTQVIESPVNQATAEFKLPFEALELENLLLKMGAARRTMRRVESSETQAVKEFGGRLFGALFTGNVLGAFAASENEAQRQGKGLRVRLRLTDASALAGLPWEFLYDHSHNRFLALSVETPIVRYPEQSDRIDARPVQLPLRILVVISSPHDYDALDVQGEWEKLRQALSELEARKQVKLERLAKPTLDALQDQLHAQAYHIFHFLGHGTYDERAEDGVLLFEDEHGRGRRVSAQRLGWILHDHRSLRLAVLNSCEGARASPTDPYAGTAQSLVQQGIPAVIAMQFEISDDAAITFAQEFYRRLAEGDPVDYALGLARQKISNKDNEVEWGTPVLYLRAPNGKIFDLADAGAAQGQADPLESIRDRLRGWMRQPLTWGIAAAILFVLGTVVFLLTRPPVSNVQLGDMVTAGGYEDAGAERFKPKDVRSVFTTNDQAVYIMVEMRDVPKATRLDFRITRRGGGFDVVEPSLTIFRDVQNEPDAWWFYELPIAYVCSRNTSPCPGTFDAQLLVNGAPSNKLKPFAIGLAPTWTPTIPLSPTATATLPATATATHTLLPTHTQTAPSPTRLETPAATPTLLANAPSIISAFVIPAEELRPEEYVVEAGFLPGNASEEFFRVTRVAYGELDDGTRVYDVRAQVKNATHGDLRLVVDRKFFSLEDRLGRTADLLYFCCATPESVLGTGQTRDIQWVFAARREWGGKGGESTAYFRVRGYLPLLRGAWRIPLPVLAE